MKYESCEKDLIFNSKINEQLNIQLGEFKNEKEAISQNCVNFENQLSVSKIKYRKLCVLNQALESKYDIFQKKMEEVLLKTQKGRFRKQKQRLTKLFQKKISELIKKEEYLQNENKSLISKIKLMETSDKSFRDSMNTLIGRLKESKEKYEILNQELESKIKDMEHMETWRYDIFKKKIVDLQKDIEDLKVDSVTKEEVFAKISAIHIGEQPINCDDCGAKIKGSTCRNTVMFPSRHEQHS